MLIGCHSAERLTLRALRRLDTVRALESLPRDGTTALLPNELAFLGDDVKGWPRRRVRGPRAAATVNVRVHNKTCLTYDMNAGRAPRRPPPPPSARRRRGREPHGLPTNLHLQRYKL
ncbi:unnamed protein product, partial [Iphiclides podalirius]